MPYAVTHKPHTYTYTTYTLLPVHGVNRVSVVAIYKLHSSTGPLRPHQSVHTVSTLVKNQYDFAESAIRTYFQRRYFVVNR